MKVYTGIDLGSTTTKAVLVDARGGIVGRGITNSRSNYELAAEVARGEALVSARFTLLQAALEGVGLEAGAARALAALRRALRLEQHLHDLGRLHAEADAICAGSPELAERVGRILEAMERQALRRARNGVDGGSDFFRDRAASAWSRLAEVHAERSRRPGAIDFEALMGVFDKAILRVENTPAGEGVGELLRAAVERALPELGAEMRDPLRRAVDEALAVPLEEEGTIGTGYGRQRLPFPREAIRSEILCHGLGAHLRFPRTRTVLDIGGQDTKAIQVDGHGIVTSFQMNDRCAAGCGRYLGYIADEMNLGVHELGPLALQATRRVRISSTCTVFAGAELRDRLTAGERREDILAGLHRAIILRAMSLLARSGGVREAFTFTGGVANNPAAVAALRQLVRENYGERTINISPDSIYMGALGAATFCLRAAQARGASVAVPAATEASP